MASLTDAAPVTKLLETSAECGEVLPVLLMTIFRSFATYMACLHPSPNSYGTFQMFNQSINHLYWPTNEIH